MDDPPEEDSVMIITEDTEQVCWGCGLHIHLPSYAPIFKCGWCGAITDLKKLISKTKYSWWRRFRDRCFVTIILGFMLFIICGGVWAVYPVVFSVNIYWGLLHSLITMALSVSTLSSFSFAAFRSAGTPSSTQWGCYPSVQKNQLDNYRYCHLCAKPKSPRTHHCRSCGLCILDMDHHCPFIGNCVGAANHRHFIWFLISTVISTFYVAIMCAYSSVHMWPSMTFKPLRVATAVNSFWLWNTLKDIISSFLSSVLLLSPRGLVVLYLFMASVSINIGLIVLLWQQLSYIYEGRTYLARLSSLEPNINEEKDCKNLFRFFGCPYSLSRYIPRFSNSRKVHKK